MENEFVCFHTGLYTRRYKAIYGCFDRNKRQASMLDWYFRGFSDVLSPWLKYVSPLPKKPSYDMAQYGVNYNPEWPIRVNIDHILGDGENLSRLPASIRDAQNLPLLLETAVELARRKAVIEPGIEAYHEVMEALTDTSDLDTEREQLQNESEVIMGLIRKAIEDNAQKAMDQAEYEKKYTGFCERYEAARQRLSEIEELRLERNAKRAKIDMFLAQLTGCGGLVTEFDEELWYSTVDFVTVYGDMRMVFTFRDGREVIVKKDAWKAA